MQVQNIKSQFDNKMVPLELNEGVMNNIIKCIKDPITCPNKDNIPQWKFCTVKGNIRCNDNMDKTNILILDYDDVGYSYQEFEDRFRGYKYFLHTSYSYNGTNSKFRVLLFLDKEYEIDRLFCIESFQQLAVYWFKKNRPSVIRGQLSTDFYKGLGEIESLQKNLLLNFLSSPDFIEFNHNHVNSFCYSVCRRFKDYKFRLDD